MNVSSHNHLIRVQKFGPSPYINVIEIHIGYTMFSTQIKRKDHRNIKIEQHHKLDSDTALEK